MLKKILLLLFLLFIQQAYASEQINNFNSTIIVNKNASIDITETINVHAEGDKILHGLVRRLPLDYTDSYGINRHTRYQITKILFNNSTAPYHIKHVNNQLAIYIGDKNTLLQVGNYTYIIQYHINNAVNFLKDADELYWNITGNDWDFSIVRAEAKITLPDTAVISNAAAYTGIKGEKGKDFIISYPAKNSLQVVTTNEIRPGEGLTIATAWQKGIIIQPTFFEFLQQSLNTTDLIFIGLAILIFIHYYIAWYKHGRNLSSKTIIPLFEPPTNITPEAMRFIMHMGYDKKTFTTAIVNMATSGYLIIENSNDEFTLTKNPSYTFTLPAEEERIAEVLFCETTSIELKQKNNTSIRDAEDKFKSTLKKNYEDKYFITNTKYWLFGLGLSVLAFFIAITGSNDVGETGFLMLWLTGWTAGCGAIVYRAWTFIQQAFTFKSFKFGFEAIYFSLFAIPFLLAECFVIYIITTQFSIILVPFIFLILILNVIFYFLLKAPTLEGRSLMDQISGFRLYLKTTERYRLKQMHAPTITPTLFEKYLPYAIALNVENAWAAQFDDVLKQAGMESAHYQPTWYASNTPWTSNSMLALPAALGMGITSALAATSVNSSASGGGGSSGGGGGGGGGGGW